jgi:ribose transport system substrate-binding protein
MIRQRSLFVSFYFKKLFDDFKCVSLGIVQHIVDYNLVGQIQIVGYFSNDTILDAVDKQVIFSTISVDTTEMGRSCIQALYEYNNMGYTNSYLPVGIEVVDQAKAHQMLYKKEDREGEQ